MKLGGNHVYLCTIAKEGHTALTIDPYLCYAFYPIPQEKGVRIQEGSLLLMFNALGIPSWGTFGLAILTWGVWAPFSIAVPSFQFKWAVDLEVFTSGHSQIKCSMLLQW